MPPIRFRAYTCEQGNKEDRRENYYRKWFALCILSRIKEFLYLQLEMTLTRNPKCCYKVLIPRLITEAPSLIPKLMQSG